MSTKDTILKQLAENPVIIYMKGVPTAPECGFSGKAVEILNATKIPYTYVNVMKAPFIRERLPSISHWPTFPQLFINGELIGGCDIIEALAQDGSLIPKLQSALKPVDQAVPQSMSHSEVESLILKDYPQAKIYLEGEGCNLTITVISDQFANLPMVKQHQGVMATLREPLATGRLHAITLKTFSHAQWDVSSQIAKPGLLQIEI